MVERYRAEFNMTPVLIKWIPAFVLLSLLFGAGTGIILSGFILVGPPLLLGMFLVMASIKRSSAIVFTDAFEYSTSLTSRSVRRIEASKIESVDFRESIIGRSGWGTVAVRGAGIRKLVIKNVRNPEKLADALRSIASSGISKGSNSQSSVTTKIQELNQLLKDGLISQKEFDSAKSKILDL